MGERAMVLFVGFGVCVTKAEDVGIVVALELEHAPTSNTASMRRVENSFRISPDYTAL
jgi:hypothetical protein